MTDYVSCDVRDYKLNEEITLLNRYIFTLKKNITLAIIIMKEGHYLKNYESMNDTTKNLQVIAFHLST